MTFVLRYGGRAEVCFRSALEALGWLEMEEEGGVIPQLVLQPYSRVCWDSVLSDGSSEPLCACYPIRTALVRKDALVALVSRLDPACAPRGVVLSRGIAEEVVNALVAGWGSCIVKCPAQNNALGIRLCGDASEVWRAFQDVLAANELVSEIVVQQYICGVGGSSLFLHQGRFKFHGRVNVLAVGSCAVYVHKDIVCHVACEAFSSAPGSISGAPFAHITNHVVQRRHPHFKRELNTLLLPALLAMQTEAEDCFDAKATLEGVASLIANVFRVAVQGKQLFFPPLDVGAAAAPPTAAAHAALPFLPARNCFEVFGVDVLFLRSPQADSTRQLAPILLEVNAGPALEGLALPALCAAVCRDTMELVLSHIPIGANAMPERLAWAHPPIPSPTSGYFRVL